MDSMAIQSTLQSLSGMGQLNQLAQGGLTGGVGAIPGTTRPEIPGATDETGAINGIDATNGPSFQDTLKSYLSDVNDQVNNADQGMADLAAGKTSDIHNVLINMRKADFQVKLLVETRNKVLDAYKDIMSISA